MRYMLDSENPFRDRPLAGLSANARMRRFFEAIGGRQATAEQGVGAEGMIWVKGLFPFIEQGWFERFLTFAKQAAGGFWPALGRKDQGVLYLPPGTAIDTFGDLKREHMPGESALPLFKDRDLVPLNTTADFIAACRIAYGQNAESMIERGVLLLAPDRARVDDSVRIEPEAVIGPDVTLMGETRIGARAHIMQGCVLTDVVVAEDAVIKPYSVLDSSYIGADASVGPFAHIRPGTRLEEGARVGNFVETKKVVLGKGSKASHLTYLGDAVIGSGCNIGAGTITCNYDGFNKHLTTLGDRVFIGSDSQLVAPVTLGSDSFVAAGSTITKDVPDNALAICRAVQTNKEGAAERIRGRARRFKEKKSS